MSPGRRIALAVAGVVGLLLVGATALMADVVLSMPSTQGPRVQSGEIVGLDAGGSYVYIVPTAHGAVVVDAGFSPAAMAPVIAEIGQRTVEAVLLTHGHLDHWGGLSALPDVPVWCGPGETSMIRGETRPRGWAQVLVINHVVAVPPPPPQLLEAKDGQDIAVDGESFRVIHVPGHTPGSVAFLWKDVLFSGDAALGYGDHVAPTPWMFADDYALNVASLARLADVGANVLADGHAGIHPEIAPQLAALKH